MTERQKMEAGYLYYGNDVDLVRDRCSAKDLCHQFNQCLPSDFASQQKILRLLFGSTKENFFLTAPFWCDYGYHIFIGENFYTNHNCVILDCAEVSFGDNVFIAPNCCFSTVGHPLDTEERNSGLEFALPIRVGDNVWFGANVTVLPGVTIGSDVVIGAGSVVTKDIPSGVVAVGNPCRILRKITEADKQKYPVFHPEDENNL